MKKHLNSTNFAKALLLFVIAYLSLIIYYALQ
jgi:hypothetical protein